MILNFERTTKAMRLAYARAIVAVNECRTEAELDELIRSPAWREDWGQLTDTWKVLGRYRGSVVRERLRQGLPALPPRREAA